MTNISPELARRLERLEPDETVRAVLLLRTATPNRSSGQRHSIEQRRAAIRKIRDNASPALSEIERTLRRFGGRLLGGKVGVVGDVLIEATADGIRAVASSERVKAVLEDQRISLASAPGQ